MKDIRLRFYGSILGCIGVAVLLGYVLPAGWKPFGLLTWGVALEFAALARILVDVSEASRLHGKPGLLTLLGLRRAEPRIQEAVGHARMGATLTGTLEGIRSPQNLEDRVRYLEDDVKALTSTLVTARKAIEAELKRLQRVDQIHTETLQKAIGDIKGQLKEMATGGIEAEYWWVVLLATGLILTNYNEQIARWFS